MLVAPGVVRYAVNGRYLDRPCVNILDMVVLVDNGFTSRDDHIVDLAGHIINVWCEETMRALSSSYTFDSVSWVDLNAETGSVGIRTQSDDYTLPLPADLAGEPYAGSVATLVTKETSSRRGSRAGRMFLPPAPETYITGNNNNDAYMVLVKGALSEAVERLTETGNVADYNYFPTVVHTRNDGTPASPNIVYVNNTQVTNFAPAQRLSSQRRRNRG